MMPSTGAPFHRPDPAAGRFLHPALDAGGVDDAVFDFVRLAVADGLADHAALLLAVFRRNQVGPGMGGAAHELRGRIAGDVFNGVRHEVDLAVRAEAEHRARHLRHDGAEAFLALADVLEQALDRHPHLLQLLRQAAQFIAAGDIEAGFEIAVRQAVGEAHQLAQRLDQAGIQEQHNQQQRHHQLRRQHEHVGQLLLAQLLLAARIVHLDHDAADALAAHEDFALGAIHVAVVTRRAHA
jgi:hypothetical protein